MVPADTSLLQRNLSPSLMSDIPDQTRDNPVARILVWTAIMTAAATFWFVVAMMALTWLRHS
jgi:multisubunit Na+/H+ antiporter MnhC subunit